MNSTPPGGVPRGSRSAANELVELLLDAIDREPEDLRGRLLRAIKAGRHHAYVQADRSVVATFDGIPEVHYVLVPPQRRSDA